MADLTTNDLISTAQSQIYTQDYKPQTIIDGVQIVPLKNMVGDEGDFSEVLRFDDKNELRSIPGFKIKQMNRTRLFPGAIKAWHVHYKQNEIWYLPPAYQLFVGLWDLRNGSSTANKTMRINLGGGQSKLLYIPSGVAHGSLCLSNEQIELFYFVDQEFSLQDPDEHRIHWDTLGKEFWTPERD